MGYPFSLHLMSSYVYLHSKANYLEILGNYILNHTSVTLKLTMCILISLQSVRHVFLFATIVSCFLISHNIHSHTHPQINKLALRGVCTHATEVGIDSFLAGEVGYTNPVPHYCPSQC